MKKSRLLCTFIFSLLCTSLFFSVFAFNIFVTAADKVVTISDYVDILNELNEKYNCKMRYTGDELPDMSLNEFKDFYEKLASDQIKISEKISSVLSAEEISDMYARHEQLELENELTMQQESNSNLSSIPVTYAFLETDVVKYSSDNKVKFTASYYSLYDSSVAIQYRVGDLDSYSATAKSVFDDYYNITYTTKTIDAGRTWTIHTIGTFRMGVVIHDNFESYIEYNYVIHN